MENELGRKIMKKNCWIESKDLQSLQIKNKNQKECVIKSKLKFENYKNCLEATQLVNKVSYVEKNKIDTDSIKENQKKFIKKNKSMLKIQKRFKSERHNVFTEKINRISLSSNDDKNAINWFDRNI